MSPDMFEDDEAYELRIARRQWLGPEKKEKVMGKLKEMLFNYGYMEKQEIFSVLGQCNLLGFGRASYEDLENMFGPPAIGEFGRPDADNPVIEFYPDGQKLAVYNLDLDKSVKFSVLIPNRTEKTHVTISCAWGLKWDDGHGVVIHDRNPATDNYEDTKHWHVTGTREGWYRLNHGFVCDPHSVMLESVEVLG